MVSDNLFAAARTGAGMSQEKAAITCGISVDSYRTRERNPGEFRMKEIRLLAMGMGDKSRKVLEDAVVSYFLSK